MVVNLCVLAAPYLLYILMARGRSQPRRTNRRPGRQVKQRLRALSMRPARVTPPADPPVINLTPEGSARLRLSVLRGTASDTTWDYGSRASVATITIGPQIKSVSVAITNVAQCIRKFGSLERNTNLELCIKKVCAWGPVPTAAMVESLPRLVVDTGPPAAGLSISDRHAPNHRSRMGITLPFTHWFDGNNSHTVCVYQPDVDGDKLGIIDISVVWRLEPP